MLPEVEGGVDAAACCPAEVQVPSTQGLNAIVQFTNTDKLHQKLLYLQCIPAAATSTKYDDNIDVLLPLMEELGHDEDQPEEVKLEIAAQLPALGRILHDQQESSGCEPEDGSNHLLRLVNLAVHLLEDEEERVVLASQTAVLEIAPWLDHTQLHETLLPSLDKLMLCPEHEIRSAVTQLYAHLGPALLSSSEGSPAQDADAIQGVLMQRVLDQAEDMDFQVRREVAIGLAVLGAALPAEGNHDTLLGAYVTLCSDRVWAVRKACADILPEIAKLAKAEKRETQLLPVFDKFCEDVSHWVQTSALQQLGPFISTLEAHHIPQSLLQRVIAIPDLEVTGDEASQLRLATAFNFPAVLASAGLEKWPQLRPAHSKLLLDREPAVRRTLACSLHELAALLGAERALADLGPAIQELCRDKHADVQEGLVNFFPSLLANLPCKSRASFFQTLTQSLSLECATWRCRIGLATQLGSLASLEGLQPDILPIAMMLCQDPTAAVRSAVAKQMGRVVCALWPFQQAKQGSSITQATNAHQEDESSQLANGVRDISLHQAEDLHQHIQDSDMQKEVVRCVHSLVSQDAYQLRQQFVEVCYHVAKACCELQMTVFRTHFMPAMLILSQDHIANVRLALARVLSLLRSSELAGLPEVLGTLDVLARDKDFDVVNCVKQQPCHKIEPDI